MASLADIETLALAMPEVTKAVDDEGRPSYSFRDKVLCWHRSPRPDAVDAKGNRLEDVFVFRVPDLEVKELILSDDRGVFFTTPHWKGYPAVLIRIPHLRKLRKAEVRDLVEDAWLVRAPKRLANAWIAEHGEE